MQGSLYLDVSKESLLMELGQEVGDSTATWPCGSCQACSKTDHLLASDVECLEETGLEYGLFYLFSCYF